MSDATRTGPGPDAKADAKVGVIESAESMSAADTSLLLTLIERHKLSHDSLAAAANLSPSYFSRVLSGQYPVSARLLRVLYERTHDKDLLAYLLGDEAQQTIVIPPQPFDARNPGALSLHSCESGVEGVPDRFAVVFRGPAPYLGVQADTFANKAADYGVNGSRMMRDEIPEAHFLGSARALLADVTFRTFQILELGRIHRRAVAVLNTKQSGCCAMPGELASSPAAQPGQRVNVNG